MEQMLGPMRAERRLLSPFLGNLRSLERSEQRKQSKAARPVFTELAPASLGLATLRFASPSVCTTLISIITPFVPLSIGQSAVVWRSAPYRLII